METLSSMLPAAPSPFNPNIGYYIWPESVESVELRYLQARAAILFCLLR